jgi:hypothetical protein
MPGRVLRAAAGAASGVRAERQRRLSNDHDGVVWQGWRVSGHFVAFDRSKCRSTKDPKTSGQSCPEGVRGRTAASGTDQGLDINSRMRFTDVFLKRNGEWQAVPPHASRLAA